MRNEVRYVDGGGQRPHPLYDLEYTQKPLEELLEDARESGYSGSWLAHEVLNYCFADDKPKENRHTRMDWRYARGRLAYLAKRTALEEVMEMGPQIYEAVDWLRAKMNPSERLDSMQCLEQVDEMKFLMRWLFNSRKNRRMREGTMRIYLLALEVTPEAMRTPQGKTMTLDHMAAAFGEPGKAARARWSWRAKHLLAGLPRMKWQRVKGGMPAAWRRREDLRDQRPETRFSDNN